LFLAQNRELLSGELAQFTPGPGTRLDITDPFLATAVLQKSLRRADRKYALGAARALLGIDPARMWRRLVVVAFEDFGLSNLTLTAQIVAAASDKAWRKSAGGEELVMFYLLARLLECPRDRQTDELYMLAVKLSQVGNPETAIQQLGATERFTALLRQAVALVLQCEQVVAYRGVRSVLAKECDVALARMAIRGWVDHGLLEACMQGRRTSQCLLPVLLPLLSAATGLVGGQTSS
jgi:hypothetical protein